jgi:hypothetical protein
MVLNVESVAARAFVAAIIAWTVTLNFFAIVERLSLNWMTYIVSEVAGGAEVGTPLVVEVTGDTEGPEGCPGWAGRVTVSGSGNAPPPVLAT